MSNRSLGRIVLGAALGVAATIAVTQAWQVTAAPGDEDSTFVPTEPCRLFDTRPGKAPLGGKKTPLGPGVGSVHTQQVTGSVGDCVGIPSEAVAVSMNVTIVGPTAQSNLRVYPANQTVPTASNLNWLANQSPTPNKVDVKLSPDGKIRLFNQAGTVHVLADVVGYYTPSSLTEIDSRLSALESSPGGSPALVDYDAAADEVDLDAKPVSGGQIEASSMLTTTINAPEAGQVSLVANATAKSGGGVNPRLVCQIAPNAQSTIAVDTELGIASPVTGGAQPTLGTNRVFDVNAGANTFKLLCTGTAADPDNPTNKVTIHYRSMTALFTPDS